MVNDQSFLLRNDRNLTTVMQIIALSEEKSETYGIKYRIVDHILKNILTNRQKTLDLLEIIN
jgi:hypothetical protein